MSRLPQVRQQLLTLHRALLDAQRLELERTHGRLSAGAFLERAVTAPELAWLRPMTALIVSLGEAVDAPRTESAEEQASIDAAYSADVRRLLVADPEGSEAERRYAAALQEAPEVVLAHGAVMRALT